jgi:hypothetical protein
MAATLAQTFVQEPLRVPARRSISPLLPLASIAFVLGVLLATLPSIAQVPVATGIPARVDAPPAMQAGSPDALSGGSGNTMPEHPDPGMDR